MTGVKQLKDAVMVTAKRSTKRSLLLRSLSRIWKPSIPSPARLARIKTQMEH